MSVESDAYEIVNLVNEVSSQKLFLQQVTDDERDQLQEHIIELFDRIDKATQRIIAECEPALVVEQEVEEVVQEQPIEEMPKKETKFYLSKKTRKKYLRDIGASEEIIERLIHPKKDKKEKDETIEYTVYKPSFYGKIANVFVGGITSLLLIHNKKLFASLNRSLQNSDIKVFSKTYVSMQVFSSLLSFFAIAFLSVMVNLVLGTPLLFVVVSSVLLAFFGFLVTFGIFYVYPSIVAGARRRKIKNDLPFVIINMAAVAGSGAKPISMFKLLLSSGEYKGVETEIRKIVNYVNLFGYDISTAMKTVAKTTPLKEFQELLIGLVSTIESGGSLRSYLQSKSEEAMSTYKLERKKYVDVISTYSDIYTSVLIAAPLLFIVTLAIIGVLGGDIAGISVSTIAMAGTFIVIPILNVIFILFLNIIQPEI